MGRKLYAEGQGFNPTTGIDDVEGLREELDALKGGSGGGGGDTTAIERRLATAEGEIDALQGDVAEQSKEIAAVGAKVNTLQGTDTGKSVRTIAAEETAKIVGGAPANYDTLKEIADYISSDAEGAAELRNKVNKNATDIATLQSTKASKSEAQGYATTAKNEAIATAAADAQEKANTAENNAKTYADSNKLGKTEKAADSAKADSATNAATLGGVPLAYKWDGANRGIPFLSSTGIMEFGRIIDFHIASEPSGTDYATRLRCQETVTGAQVYLPSKSGTLALATDNVASATKLATSRKIWGQSFDGSGNVDGDMEVNGDVVIKGNVVIEGNITSGASYQSNPLSTISEGEVPSVEQQLRSQISSLEERIAALEQIIAQNNG